MKRRPLWGRLLAAARGEVPATTLEAYRRAGSALFELLHEVEDHRRGYVLAGADPWQVPPAVQAFMLCVWNAHALQTLGDHLLDADYHASPATAGYVAPATADQVLTFYADVGLWLSRAHQARTNPQYALDLEVPADLPRWLDPEQAIGVQATGLLAAIGTIRSSLEATMAWFESCTVSDAHAADLLVLQERLAGLAARAEYAERLAAQPRTPELTESIIQHARSVVELAYQIGQLLAMPTLAAHSSPGGPGASRQRSAQSRALPGRAGFDPWVLTEPSIRKLLRRDQAARREIDAFWASDADPSRTLAIQAEIEAAIKHADAGYLTNSSGETIAFNQCPWAPIYVMRKSRPIGGQFLFLYQQFTFAPATTGSEPRRRLLLGNFRAAAEPESSRLNEH